MSTNAVRLSARIAWQLPRDICQDCLTRPAVWLLAAWLCAFAIGPPHALADQTSAPSTLTSALSEGSDSARAGARVDDDLLAIIVDGRETGTLLVVRRNARFWLPLEDLAPLIAMRGLDDQDKKHNTRVATPLGPVGVPETSIFHRNGVKYVDQAFFTARLNITFHFDAETYGLVVDLPWPANAVPRETLVEPASLAVDVLPPPYGIATIQGDSYVDFRSTGDTTALGSIKATGHAYGGIWQARYNDDIIETHAISEAIWMKDLSDNQAIQIGHQNIALHPSLDGVTLTGLQYAWTSRANQNETEYFSPGALIERRSRHHRLFSGAGPVGGLAELWINDIRVAQTFIDLTQRYEFSDILIPTGHATIEVRVYDSRNPTVPIQIIRDETNLSDLLLEGGQSSVVVAAGAAGNAFDWLREETRDSDGMAGIAFARYAPNDIVTLEAGATHQDSETLAMLGAVARLGENTMATGAVAAGSQGTRAYDVEVEWRTESASIIATSNWRFSADDENTAQQQVGAAGDDENWEHVVRLERDFGTTLTLGAIALASDETKFVLPYFTWQPNARLTISGRPDRRGDYRIDAQYHVSANALLSLSMNEDAAFTSYVHRISDQLSFIANLDTVYGEDVSGSVGLLGNRLFGSDISWRTSLSATDGRWGFDGYVSTEVSEGMLAFAELSHDSHHGRSYGSGGNSETRLRVGVTFNYAVSDGELVGTNRGAVSRYQGGLAGRIVANGAAPDDLEGIPVLIDDAVVARTGPDGAFYIPNLAKGNHAIEFDEGELPIEYVTSRRRMVAQVAPGAVTKLSFLTQVQYGAAGRVLDPTGAPGAEIPLVVHSAAGERVAQVTTNGFGYFRADGLVPGNYIISTAPEWEAGATVSRGFTITDDYVFEIDMRLKEKLAQAETPAETQVTP